MFLLFDLLNLIDISYQRRQIFIVKHVRMHTQIIFPQNQTQFFGIYNPLKLHYKRSVFQYSMDKLTKNYIDDIVKPMLNRIEALQRSNSELQVQVKYLQSLINSSGGYQKPTISAANHTRNSRISSKGQSAEKRPGWNSKTKIDQSPSATNKEAVHHEKLKAKPPIPKIMKSPNKNEPHQEMRCSGIDKKIVGGVKYQADNSQKKNSLQASQISPIKSSTNSVQNKEVNQNSTPEQTLGKVSNGINNTFEQLVKNNTEILASMKDNIQAQKQTLKPAPSSPSNYVLKANAPKSECNQSQTTSSNERSFASEANPQEKAAAKVADGLKVNLECNMAKIQLN